MKLEFVRAISVGALIFAVAHLNLRPQNAEAPADVKAFAAQYVAEFNAKHKIRLESLLIPESRKPERELQIDYQYPESNDAGGIDIWLVRRDGHWMADIRV